MPPDPAYRLMCYSSLMRDMHLPRTLRNSKPHHTSKQEVRTPRERWPGPVVSQAALLQLASNTIYNTYVKNMVCGSRVQIDTSCRPGAAAAAARIKGNGWDGLSVRGVVACCTARMGITTRLPSFTSDVCCRKWYLPFPPKRHGMMQQASETHPSHLLDCPSSTFLPSTTSHPHSPPSSYPQLPAHPHPLS